ncbi:hypothetical protein [Bacillus sp. B1-b2]|nr:hypothetical protein [Bacillus sp. B1-b2]
MSQWAVITLVIFLVVKWINITTFSSFPTALSRNLTDVIVHFS